MLQLGSIWVDIEGGVVERDDTTLLLTDKESALLQFLADRPGSLVSRAQLNAEVWGYHPSSSSRAIDKTLARLRAKIERDTARPRFLITIRGEGWRLVLPAPEGTSLPAPRGVLFGREVHAAQVEGWWQAGVRWITIIGVGGLGKTQLALTLARSAAETLRVRWVDLTDVDTLDGLRGAVVSAMGLKSSSTLAGALAQQVDLLVLDNLDDIAEESGAQLGDWLSSTPRLRILGTSQVRIFGAGERTFQLPPLSAAHGAEMLMAHAGWPAAATTDAMVISRQLDGLPLALELVATSAGPLPPAVVARRVADILACSRLSGTPTRHTTIEATVRGSWLRLSPIEQRALAALVVLPGSFALSVGEEAVGGVDPLHAMMSLMKHSLIQQDGEQLRLPGPIRRHAGHSREEQDTARARLIAHLTKQVYDLEDTPAPYRQWMNTVGTPLLEAALQWARSTGSAAALVLIRPVDAVSAVSSSARLERLERVLTEVPCDERDRIRVQLLKAAQLTYGGRFAEGDALFASICARAHALGWTELEARAWMMRSARGPAAERIQYAQKSIALASDPLLRVMAMISKGFAQRTMGDPARARSTLLCAREQCEDATYHTKILIGLGGLCATTAEARDWMSEADEADEAGLIEPLYLPNMQLLRGYLHLQIGEPERAVPLLIAARRHFLRVSDHHNRLHALWNLCLSHLLRGEPTPAHRYLSQAEVLATTINNPISQHFVYGALCSALLSEDVAAAQRVLAENPGTFDAHWVALTAAISRDLEGVRAVGNLTRPQRAVLEALAGDVAIDPEDAQALRAERDFHIEPRMLVAVLENAGAL